MNLNYTKMDPALKKEWLAALRSGDYEQGKMLLCNVDAFCCLGVLWDQTDNWWQMEDMHDGSQQHWAPPGYPPNSRTPLPVALVDQEAQVELSTMNDRGDTFPQIADWIEKNL